MKCSACGVENRDESRFCKSCGVALTPSAPPAPSPVAAQAPPPPPPPPAPPFPFRSYARHRQPHQELVGLIGLALFLVAVGTVLSVNPSLWNDLGAWSDLVAANGPLVRPPMGVLTSAALLFAMGGFFDFVGAGLRLALGWTLIHPLGKVLSGVGSLSFGLLLWAYADGSLTATQLFSVLAAVVGALLITYLALGLYWGLGTWFPVSQADRPPVRP